MADELGIGTFTSPAVGVGTGVQFDVTAPGLTEDGAAAVILFSATTTDDSAVAPNRVGISLVDRESPLKARSQCTICRDGLAAPSNRTCIHNAAVLFVPRDSSFFNQFDSRCKYVSSITGGFRFETDLNPLVQTKAAALIFAGAGVRSWTVEAHATTTPTDYDCGVTTPTDVRFQPHFLVVVAKDGRGSFGQLNDAVQHLGFVLNDGSDTQVVSWVDCDDATEPSAADGEVRDDAGGVGYEPTSRTLRRLTFEFLTTGFRVTSDGGDVSFAVLAVRMEREPMMAVGSAALASTLSEVLSFDPEVVLGMVSGVSSLDSLESGAAAGGHGLSLFSPSAERAYSGSYKTGESTTSSAKTRQGDHALLLLDHLGAVAAEGTYAGTASPHGFELSLSPAGSGRFTYLALSRFRVMPDPIDAGPDLPSPTFPSTVQVGAPPDVAPELPAVTFNVPRTPDPDDVAVALPSPTVYVWTSTPSSSSPDLEPAVSHSLAALLPRGLAWSRSPSS